MRVYAGWEGGMQRQPSQALRSDGQALSCRACPLRHRKRCHLSQGERLWQAGPLFTGRPRPDRAQKGGPCYRGQARLRTTSQALRASSPSRGASGETVHFAGTAKASPTRGGGIAQAMTERLYEGRGFGRPEGAKTPFGDCCSERGGLSGQVENYRRCIVSNRTWSG